MRADSSKRCCREHRSSIAVYRQALSLDPDFATAWSRIGTNYRNLGLLDSAQAAWDMALSKPGRLSESQRTYLEVIIASEVKHDLAGAPRLADLGLSQFPESAGLRQLRYVLLGTLGRYEEAYDECLRYLELYPFGPDQIALTNHFELLVQLGRHQEAREVMQAMKGSTRQLSELTLLLATSNWARAETLATDLQGDLTANHRSRFEAQVALASMPAIRGAVAASARALEELPDQAFSPAWAHIACLARLQLRITSAGTVVQPDGKSCTDTTTAGLIVQGVRAAVLGDVMWARRLLETIRLRPAPDGREYAVEFKLLEGWIAARDSDWDRVIRLLEPSMTRGQAPRLTGRLPIRWLVAEAQERLGHLEAAASAFELVLSPLRFASRWMGQEECVRAIYWPFAHQRLVLIYAKLGKAEEARQHWSILEQTFTQPDPELVPLIEQARKAIEGLKTAS